MGSLPLPGRSAAAIQPKLRRKNQRPIAENRVVSSCAWGGSHTEPVLAMRGAFEEGSEKTGLRPSGMSRQTSRMKKIVSPFVILAVCMTSMFFQSNANAQSAKEKGEAFLKENATKEGVKSTPSGLQYLVLEEGKGKTPAATDTVLVHYKGTLLDGTEFDSSYKRNEPISFPLNGVIPGWTEGVQLMKEGGKTRLFIPSNLAYGPRGAGGAIGPNETLIFDIELLEVK